METLRTIRSALRSRAVTGTAIALIAMGAAGCEGGAEDVTVVGQGDRPELGVIDAGDGEQLTVRGEVTRVVSPAVFFLSTEEGEGGDILILGGAETAVAEGQTVEVTGEIRHIAAGFAQDTGLDPGQEGLYEAIGLDGEEDFIAFYEGDTSIVADNVDVLDPG